MPRQKKTARAAKKRVNWTAAELKILRKHAGKKSAAQIAGGLKGRTPAAVQRKATSEGIPLRRRA